MLISLFFYLFATLCVASGMGVIFARNPVYSVLSLIFAFVNAAGLFILLGAEFLAMLLVIVYVGAVAVLFLFVVMMLDIDITKLREGFLNYLPLGLLIGFGVAVELVLVSLSWVLTPTPLPPVTIIPSLSNTQALGHILYTDYALAFQTAGIILLTAMISAIVLTHRHREDVKRQQVGEQNARTPRNAIEIRKVPFRTGLQEEQ